MFTSKRISLILCYTYIWSQFGGHHAGYLGWKISDWQNEIVNGAKDAYHSRLLGRWDFDFTPLPFLLDEYLFLDEYLCLSKESVSQQSLPSARIPKWRSQADGDTSKGRSWFINLLIAYLFYVEQSTSCSNIIFFQLISSVDNCGLACSGNSIVVRLPNTSYNRNASFH